MKVLDRFWIIVILLRISWDPWGNSTSYLNGKHWELCKYCNLNFWGYLQSFMVALPGLKVPRSISVFLVNVFRCFWEFYDEIYYICPQFSFNIPHFHIVLSTYSPFNVIFFFDNPASPVRATRMCAGVGHIYGSLENLLVATSLERMILPPPAAVHCQWLLRKGWAWRSSFPLCVPLCWDLGWLDFVWLFCRQPPLAIITICILCRFYLALL